jgi:aspartyl protease family protein
MNSHSILLAATLAASAAHATDVTVIGLFPGKAVVTINRGAPRTLSAGEAIDGVALVSSDSRGAVMEIDGKRQTLEMGQHFESAAETGARKTVILARASDGHFVADATVNGAHIRFLVDTGATLVSLPAEEALRLGIDFAKSTPGYTILADGRRVPVYRVTLESVSIGDVTLLNVEGSVRQGGGPPLLGMSFLNRTEMRYEGQNLTLTKRY